jgi:hypothetical protein
MSSLPSSEIPYRLANDNEDVSSMCSTVDYTGIEYDGFLYDPSLGSAAAECSSFTAAEDIATSRKKTDNKNSVKIDFMKHSLLDSEENNSVEAYNPVRTFPQHLVMELLDSDSEKNALTPMEIMQAKQDVKVVFEGIPKKTDQVIVLDCHNHNAASSSFVKPSQRKRRLTSQQELTIKALPRKEEQEIILLLSSDDDDGVASSVKPIHRRDMKPAKRKVSTKLAFKTEQEVILLLSDDDAPRAEKKVPPLQGLDKDIKACTSTVSTRERMPQKDIEITCNDTLHEYLHKLVRGRGSREHIATLSNKSIETYDNLRKHSPC